MLYGRQIARMVAFVAGLTLGHGRRRESKGRERWGSLGE